jgi:hypothetical protein
MKGIVDMIATERQNDYRISAHFMAIDEVVERLAPYGVGREYIDTMAGCGLIGVYTFIDGGMVQVPVSVDTEHFYIESDVERCIDALSEVSVRIPEMTAYSMCLSCSWRTERLGLTETSVEAVAIYVPTILFGRHGIDRYGMHINPYDSTNERSKLDNYATFHNLNFDPSVLSPEPLFDQWLLACTTEINQSNSLEIIFRTEDDRRNALLYYDFPAYVLPGDVHTIVSQQLIAFELFIRSRVRDQAKKYGHYPVRYIKLGLPA